MWSFSFSSWCKQTSSLQRSKAKNQGQVRAQKEDICPLDTLTFGDILTFEFEHFYVIYKKGFKSCEITHVSVCWTLKTSSKIQVSHLSVRRITQQSKIIGIFGTKGGSFWRCAPQSATNSGKRVFQFGKHPFPCPSGPVNQSKKKWPWAKHMLHYGWAGCENQEERNSSTNSTIPTRAFTYRPEVR